MEENKYTVSDVARKVHMTERTIRNYLKDGILKGTRVGGQWRFSDQDLIDLSNNSIFRKKVSDIASSYAKEYIDKKFVIEGDVTVCSIIDYKNSDQKYLDSLECEAVKIAREYRGNVRFTAISEDGRGRCTVVGTIECVNRILEVMAKILQAEE